MNPPFITVRLFNPLYQMAKGANLAMMFCFLMTGSGCAYRFSNLHMQPPHGARTIAVEAVYDTGKLAVPHEVLWEQLQKQFAINGQLRLVPRQEADLFLRAQILKSTLTPSQIEKKAISEPDRFYDETDQGEPVPHPLSAWPDYSGASSFSKSETINLNVRIEIWNLHSRKKLFSKDYGISTTWQIFEASLPPEYLFLKSEETFETSFTSMCEGMAKSVVVDFLSGHYG